MKEPLRKSLKMTESELKTLINQGESETIEFKETLDENALQTISAFSNTKGGTLLIGVRDDGTLRGITIGKETVTEWVNRIAQATHVHPQIKTLVYENKSIVAIEVEESSLKPMPCQGRYYKRVGKSTRVMTDEDLTKAVLGKCGITWDEIVEPRAKIDDLDFEQFQKFKILCNQKGRRPIPANETDATILEKLGLLQNGKLLRATTLLFGKEPQRFYQQSRVKIGRFRSPTMIVDDREIYGSLFTQIDGAELYFREHLQTEFQFKDSFSRDVIWEYPLEAVREAIINAVCHRDYLSQGDSQIRWYDDHVTFLNPGGLPESLTIEQLKSEHQSLPRNSKIAEMFFYAGLIERWGSGTVKIIQECLKAGLPEPEFAEKQGALWLTLRKDIYTKEYLQSLVLNERQMKAVQYVKEKEKITNKEYQQINDVSNKTAYLELIGLVEKQVFMTKGTGKKIIYVLKVTKK